MRKQPCHRDCPKRKPGCGATCPDWAAYIKERDEEYQRRLDACKVSEAIRDSVIRMGGNLGQR